MTTFAKAFLIGAARALDLGGSIDPPTERSTRSDAEALRSDWSRVGEDFRTAIRKAEDPQD